MNPRKRIFLLVLIMLSIVFIVESITITLLYQTALHAAKKRLDETAKSQARLIEAVARFDKKYNHNYPDGSTNATLLQIRDAHSNYTGFGETGEFTLSKKENDKIIFLLSHRHFDLETPTPVPWNSNLAEPMRLALSGKSGVIIGQDYRDVTVLAAHEPVAVLNLGIVAKIDLAEIKAPFINATIVSFVISLTVIGLGVTLFYKITNPLIQNLQLTVKNLETALEEVKTLREILPICSFCKKIRDDDGYWDQVEVYLRKSKNIDFSHGICPTCMKEHYPDDCEQVMSILESKERTSKNTT